VRPVALTVAGSDSSAGAGIQADLKTFAALGAYGTSAITAITAQNTVGVDSFERVSPDLVYAQMKSVATDLQIAALKTGMLVDAEIISAVARAIGDFKLRNLVVDPVMVAKSGHRLLLPEAEAALKEKLLPLAFIVTPNIPEAEVLTGQKITGKEDMQSAAINLRAMGAKFVLIKGGHLDGADATDILYDGQGFREFSAPRVVTSSTHGTGCTLSAAITAHLAHGLEAAGAIQAAKEYLTAALRHAEPLGHGHGPVNHFWAVSFESENRK
jgi:hydroxymethylpyrimidine/phosphomethylpyrimidine kinase